MICQFVPDVRADEVGLMIYVILTLVWFIFCVYSIAALQGRLSLLEKKVEELEGE